MRIFRAISVHVLALALSPKRYSRFPKQLHWLACVIRRRKAYQIGPTVGKFVSRRSRHTVHPASDSECVACETLATFITIVWLCGNPAISGRLIRNTSVKHFVPTMERVAWRRSSIKTSSNRDTKLSPLKIVYYSCCFRPRHYWTVCRLPTLDLQNIAGVEAIAWSGYEVCSIGACA